MKSTTSWIFPRRSSGKYKPHYCAATSHSHLTRPSRAGPGVIMDPSRRRQGGRGRRLEGTRVPQLPWTSVTNPYPPMQVLSADQLEAIHLTSLRILEELGMEVMSARACTLLRNAGAQVDP